MLSKNIKMVVYCLLIASQASAFHIDSIEGVETLKHQSSRTQLDVKNFFYHTNHGFDGVEVVTDPVDLLHAVKDTLHYMKINKDLHRCVIDPESFKMVLPVQNMQRTLEFVAKVIEEDMPSGNFRIFNSDFLASNFNVIKWKADQESAKKNTMWLPGDGRLRLTNYAVFRVDGSYKKTKTHNCALYSLLDDSIQKKYTKHQAIAGALEQPGVRSKVKPLVWLTRDGLEEAIMQGTILVNLPDGKVRVFNVDKNNGIGYDKKLGGMKEQKRYWFFRQIAAPAKSQVALQDRMTRRKNVIFAGDIFHIGLGKLVAIEYVSPVNKKKEMRIGILADTGGAFTNNLYQLDLFAGLFKHREELKGHLVQMPSYMNAFILYKP